MIIHIGDYTNTGQWSMDIDLAEVCASCGTRKKVEYVDPDGTRYTESFISLRQDQARKLFRQIWKHADHDTLTRAQEYIYKHKNLNARKQWDAAGQRFKHKRRLFASGE